MRALCILLAVLVAGAAQAGELSKREKIRAFVQVQALKQLAAWEAKKLHPKNTAKRSAEERKAVRQAYSAVAGQYKTTAAELQKIVRLGLQGDWPRPKALEGGAEMTLSPDEKAREWKQTVWAKQGVGQFKLVKDGTAKGGMAAESRGRRWGMFRYDDVNVPSAGRYRATFYVRLMETRSYKERKPELTFLVSQPKQYGEHPWRRLAQKSVDPSLLSKKRYAPVTVEFSAKEAGRVQVAIRQMNVILRVNGIDIEKIN